MGRHLGERAKRFLHLPRSAGGGALYVAEFSTGIVKIGCSWNPARRLQKIDEQLAREGAGTIVRFAIGASFDDRQNANRAEADLIVRLWSTATPVPGTREYFTDITFDAVLATVASVVSAPPAMKRTTVYIQSATGITHGEFLACAFPE